MLHLLESQLALVVVFACACSSSGEAANSEPQGDAGGAPNSDGGKSTGGQGGAPGAGGRTGAGGSGANTGGSSGKGSIGSGGRPGTGGGGTGGSLDAGGDAATSCTCAYVPPKTTGWGDRCKAYPAFPDARCTGPTSTNLPLYTGSLEFRTDNQVIENVEMRIASGLYVPADNVTFRNVKIVFTGALDSDFTMVNLNYNSGTVFQDCELDGRGNVARAITGSAVTVRNCHIHDVGNAVETETPMVIEGNYFHDIYEPPGTDWHADGIQTPQSDGGVIVRHNTIFGRDPATSAINVMGTDAKPATNVLIEHNLLAGGGYTLYTGPGSDYCVIDNHLSTQFFPKVGFYNIWYWDPSDDGDVTRCGNVIHETGADANDNL